MVRLTTGQELALQQLADIAARSNGALEITSVPLASKTEAHVWVRISIETRGYRTSSGLALRDREPFSVHLPPDFPFRKPDIYFRHKRFIGAPHVQWGSYICLYQSTETEYDPSDGMFGFIERMRVWLEAAGAGQLDPTDAPLHPPVAYPSSTNVFVIRADTPTRDLTEPAWLGGAVTKKVREGRFDVVAWTELEDWGNESAEQSAVGALLFPQPLPMEYPSKVNDLIKIIEDSGMAFGLLYRVLRLISLLTAEGQPGFLILGAPMRRKAAGEPLRPHLTTWEIGAETLSVLRTMIASSGEDAVARDKLVDWMVSAEVRWCRVMEDRAEIVQRRDGPSLMSYFSGKRALLLGCGALGSAIAESIARSGATALHLVDRDMVKPGVLVRQRYSDSDIGLPKVEALKHRLDATGLPCAVTTSSCDLSAQALTRFQLDQYDIVIDATASTRVTRRIEEELKEARLPYPMISLTVSAIAQHACVLVRMPDYLGGPHSVARQSKLEALAHAPRDTLTRAFWPERDKTEIFQPEPGCSDPTFVGSAADLDHHAALLNLGIRRVETLKPTESSVDLVAAPWSKRTPEDYGHLHYAFEGYSQAREQRHGYLLLRSASADRGIATELRRIGRARSDHVETGGLLFGEIDDCHRYIWIDGVSGPPPDSQASPERFVCGVSGTRSMAERRSARTGGSSNFIGIWHTHPVSRGRPSNDDLVAMLQLLHGQAFPPRQVLMLIVGFSATTREHNYYLYRRDEFQLIEVELPESENPR